jgi:hypothetical protein
MHKKIMYDLITWNVLPQRKNMNNGKHLIPEEVFTSANLLPKYVRNRMGIINKVAYIVYKQWSGHALINEIKDNNYDVNVLWKGNIVYF